MRFELRPTDDGSLTVFDREAGECFKSRHAARCEAEHVFFRPGVLEHPSYRDGHTFEVLELGLGLGTNFLHLRENGYRGEFRSIERDLSGLEFYLTQAPDPALTELALRGQITCGAMHATLHKGDFFVTLRELIDSGYRADALFFDPFSPKANPGAWTTELFTLAEKVLRANGRLVTYSVSRTAKDAATDAGFSIEKRRLPPELRKRSALLAIKRNNG